jgi:hypothetical protein
MHVRFPLIGTVAILVVTAGVVRAQGPAIGDIALCNEEATRKTGGSALPGPPPAPDRETRRGPGASAPRNPRAPEPLPVAPGERRGERTDPSGSVITESPDPLLQGMDASRADDEAYRTAYRECMRQRTHSTR